MANLSYTNTPLIAHLYDTSDAALESAIQLGCSGYRTYNINGESKYVPCSSFLAYENALKLYKIQGVNNAVSGLGSLGDKAVGLQFANSKDEISGDPYFTLGNFSINKSVSVKKNIGKEVTYIGGDVSYTAESINESNPGKTTNTSAVEQVNKKINDNVTVSVLFDRKKLQNYVLYAALKETIKNTVIEITQKFPAGLRLNVVGLQSPTVEEYNYSQGTDTAEFKVNLSNISNPFQIEYTSTGKTINDPVDIAPIRNFSKNYSDYVIYYQDIEYKILNATLPKSYEDYENGIYLTIEGDPFSLDANPNLTVNRTFWIKPKYQKHDEFQSNLSDMGKFLLNYDFDKKNYVSVIRYVKVTDNGVDINVNETLTFPQIDKVNIDLFGDKFDKYLTKLNTISDDFDSTKTNLITRFLTTDSLKEFDTDDRRINIMLGLMGKNFDTIRKYIDGITYMTNLSYDKIENIPDLLTKNYGNMLGFETFNVEDESTIMESIFNLEDLNIEPGITPVEIDIELWRRIFINSFYLWKSKGTRKSIEFILNLVGLPDTIFEVNEHVYVARQNVDFYQKAYEIYGAQYSDETLLTLVPIDKDGYPTVPGKVKYQESGFNISIDSKNYGPYDFGKEYINAYQYDGNTPIFKLDRVTDNVKSWVYSEDRVLRLSEDTVGYTEYYEDDSRLVVNSKELEVYLSSNKIFDFTMYRYLYRNNITVNEDLMFNPEKIVKAGVLSFNQFVQNSLDEFIKPDNRKTIRTYPTLSKIYYDYTKLTDTRVTNTKSLDFLNKFDGSWVKLVQQFTPATSILNAGKKIQNSKFIDNKFIYKHGLNDSLGWLGTDGSEFQYKANLPVNLGTTNPFQTKGFAKDAFVGETSTFTVEGKKGLNYVGYDPTINEYFGFYYGIQDACNTIASVYLWDGEENYGDDTTYNGNINITGDTNGVFVKYENTLYRLNTNRMFTGILPTINTKTIYKDSYVVLDNTNSTETITLSSGSGEYLIEFTHKGLDDLEIYDGTTSGTLLETIYGATNDGNDTAYHSTFIFSTNTLTIKRTTNIDGNKKLKNLKVILKYGTPDSFTINNQLVYESIGFGTDSSTVLFNDSSSVNINERNYYIDAIGIGHAYIANDIEYVCPVPKPHVCYFDYSGLTINMGSLGYTTSTSGTYYDETGTELSIKQSLHYGYSKDTSATEPTDAIKGVSGDWIVPYRKSNTWTNGVTYYKNDIVTYSNTNYIVDNINVTGTSTTPTGCTITTIVPGNYENFLSRAKTSPYMHIDSANIKKVTIDKSKDVVSFNLTKDIYLYQVFSGATENETYKVIDNILNDELYISDSTTLSFDGFYSIDQDKVGPFYTPNTEEILTQTLDDTLYLNPDKVNFITIQSLNTSFNTDNDKIGLADGFYLVRSNSFLKIDADLYFESTQTNTQNTIIRLQDQFDNIIYEQIFSFSGSDNPQDRVASISHESLFTVDTRVYLTVYPETFGCTLSRYEKIDIDYINPTTYSAIDDPRFRINFNAGRTILNGHYVDDVLSIEPLGDTNNYDVDHYMFKTDSDTDTYKFRPKLNINQSYDEINNFGLIFGKYYEKYKTTSSIGDVSIYEKKYNNDRFSFEVKVNTKEVSLLSSNSASQSGVNVTHTITSTNNYLGNTPQEIENTGLSKSIIFGKSPKPRTNKLKKLNFPFLKSYKNNTLLSDVKSTIDFIGHDEGLVDYDLLDYNSDLKTNFISKTRYSTTTGYWKKENAIYSTELYQDILSVVPEFSENINNYQINDIVKLILTNTDIVVENEDGTTTIENKNVERLYVCIEDITSNHLRKESGAIVTGVTTGLNIHPIYQPNGARACFIPIERYDLKSFTPIGYDKHQRSNSIRTNHKPYTYEPSKILTGLPTDQLDMGDIVKVIGTGTTYNLYQYVYNKPLLYNLNNIYKVGSFVYHSDTPTSTNYSFWLKIDESFNTEPGTETSAISWMKLDSTIPSGYTYQYNYDWISGDTINLYLNTTSATYNWDPNKMSEWDGLEISNSSLRIPNLLPTEAGVVGYGYYGHLVPYTGTQKIASDMVPNYINQNILTNNQLDGVDNIGQITLAGNLSWVYTGTTGSIYTGYTLNTNLIQNDYSDLMSNNVNNLSLNLDKASRNISPLFELICSNTTDNSIYDYSSTTTYDSTSEYNYKKYAVDRNVLYHATSINTLGTPHTNTTQWEERDFMLVSKYTLYKDRTSIKIYDGIIESLNENTKNNLYFFDSDLVLKTSFTENYFSGTTQDNKLVNGLNKLFDAKNENLRDVYSYGLTGFRKSGSDIIMDYYYERDDNSLPKTGEFIGGLTITNPCGHNAKVIFGTLFNFNESLVSISDGRLQPAPPLAELAASLVSPKARLLINQNGASNMTLTINGTNIITSNRTVLSKSMVDDTIVMENGGYITITVTYDTFKNKTIYKDGVVDEYVLFNTTDNGIDNAFVTANKSLQGKIETRTITLKDVYEDRVIKLDFEGANFIELGTVDPKDYIVL